MVHEIAAEDSIAIRLRFSPLKQQQYGGQIHIRTDEEATCDFLINLSGSTLPPQNVISPLSSKTTIRLVEEMNIPSVEIESTDPIPNVSLSIYNAVGRLLSRTFHGTLNSGSSIISLHQCSSGANWVQVSSGNTKIGAMLGFGLSR
jgi:hypothetical protein